MSSNLKGFSLSNDVVLKSATILEYNFITDETAASTAVNNIASQLEKQNAVNCLVI